MLGSAGGGPHPRCHLNPRRGNSSSVTNAAATVEVEQSRLHLVKGGNGGM